MRDALRWSMLAAALCCSAQAHAQQGADGSAGPSFTDAEFARLDANRDGRIDAEEFMAERRVAWTKYSNGTAMTLQACAQWMQEPAAAEGVAPAPEWGRQTQAGCSRLAKKGGPTIGWEEFAGPAWSFFKLLDANRDGFLSREEFADQGLSALRSSPKPLPMSERQRQVVERDLARAKTLRRQPRTLAQIQALNEAPLGAGAAPGPASAPQGGAPAQGQASPAAPADRLSGWLR